MRYIVCYDISDNSQRNQFAKRLKQLGLKRIQKSVFIGKIKKRYNFDLHNNLLPLVNTISDKVLIVPFSFDLAQRIGTFGKNINLDFLTQNVETEFW